MPSSIANTDLIEYKELLRAVGRYCHPDPVDLPGLLGVVGKRNLDPETRNWRASTPLTAEEQTLLRELVLKHAGDKATALPPLQTVMGRKERLTFRRAFRKLEGRPGWEPVLRTPEDRWRLQSLRGDVRLRHDTALKKQIAEERMRHFDDDRIQTTPHFERMTYLMRDEVQTYLSRVGLDLQALLDGPFEALPSAISAFVPDSRTSRSNDILSPPQTQKSRRHSWSPEYRRRVIEAANLGQLEQIAADFGVSIQYARQLASRFKQEAGAERSRAPLKAQPIPASSEGANASPLASNSNAGSPRTPTPSLPTLIRMGGQHSGTANSSSLPEPETTLGRLESLKSPPPNVVLRIRDVEQRIGLKRSSIYERLNPKGKYYDPSFPRPVSLAGGTHVSDDEQRTAGAVGFPQDEIEKWLAARPKR